MEYSIHDIAKRAGVSKSTVSRVFNAGSVSAKAREAVLRVLEETGYQPNQSARTLRGARSYVVGVAVTSASAFLAPSFNIRMAGMMQTLYQSGYSVLFINEAQKPTGETAPFHFLEQHIVDGLIFLQNADSDKVRRAITQHREVVYTGERILPDRGLRIYMGNYDYSRALYEYLMERGHRRIITVMSSTGGRIGKSRRHDAYADVCAQYGAVPEADSFVVEPYRQMIPGHLEKLYTKYVEGRYTALFVDSMEYADAVIRCFAAKGKVLGRDFSLVSIRRGEQGDAQADMTTIVLPDYEYGARAAQMILQAVEDPSLEYLDVKLPFELQERSSVVRLG